MRKNILLLVATGTTFTMSYYGTRTILANKRKLEEYNKK